MPKVTLHDIATGSVTRANLGAALIDKCQKPLIVKHFDPFQGKFVESVTPCGKCYSCLYVKQSDWVSRMILESTRTSSEYVYFITLTYDKRFLYTHPEYAQSTNCIQKRDGLVPITLCKKHLQDFFKRLRKYSNASLRYYACGEYGTLRQRPHYHSLIWSDQPLTRELIAKSWSLDSQPIGIISFDDLVLNGTLSDIRSDSVPSPLAKDHSIEYCAKYVAKYVTKNIEFERIKNNKDFKHIYQSLNPDANGFTWFINKPNVINNKQKQYKQKLRFYEKLSKIGFPLEPPQKPEKGYLFNFREWSKCYRPFRLVSLQRPIGLHYKYNGDYKTNPADIHQIALSNGTLLNVPRIWIHNTKKQLFSLENLSLSSYCCSRSRSLCYFHPTIQIGSNALDYTSNALPLRSDHLTHIDCGSQKDYSLEDSKLVFYDSTKKQYTLWSPYSKELFSAKITRGSKQCTISQIEHSQFLSEYSTQFRSYYTYFLKSAHDYDKKRQQFYADLELISKTYETSHSAPGSLPGYDAMLNDIQSQMLAIKQYRSKRQNDYVSKKILNESTFL